MYPILLMTLNIGNDANYRLWPNIYCDIIRAAKPEFMEEHYGTENVQIIHSQPA